MIKKVFLYGIAVLGIAAVAAWNVSLNLQQSNKLSDTMLANVEALADGESGQTTICQLDPTYIDYCNIYHYTYYCPCG
ncbi:MAG: NVEALA domain-containing protein [Dysgonamonadaceae bacterium]|jgi:hypothetical protein|nr:NVEALA domain-containing protein [Dysgonamonadaceae bacterium]